MFNSSVIDIQFSLTVMMYIPQNYRLFKNKLNSFMQK